MLLKKSLKRAYDILAGLAMLLLFSPIIILTLAGIFYELLRRGKVAPFYIKEQRASKGRPFYLYKLNMYKPEALESYIRHSKEYAEFGTYSYLQRNPDAIHGVGEIMKKYYLDELGQLWNILRGDMSMVGPRPLPLSYKENQRDVRKKLKAGLVCFASNSSKNEGSVLSGRIRDEEYLRIHEEGSAFLLLKTDLIVTLDGFRAMLRAKGF